MKKFLSLVLALIMTFSLVTIGAGATEYKDLTDKNEITYEEAVAVLNKLGIISGYSDGSFNPTGTLTRGAAAKIIVSLMIGTEAASNLAVNAAPYSDVPASHTFAGVISYCKTAGYINGYTDGTFRPADPLTGYAFTKMLLGALGYDGKQEGFSGLGWTMNVNKLGNTAGLFRDFINGFKGNSGVTREEACLLALNTLKATEVEYSGGTTISTSTGDATTSVVTNKEISYKTSNDAKINKNIEDKKSINTQNIKGTETLEFAEEHFPNLTLRSDGVNGRVVLDDYGRPANVWSLKNVKIGTYPKTADYTFTAGASGDKDADKVKDMGLKDFTIGSSSITPTLTVNGQELNGEIENGKKTTTDKNAATLVNYVKNGSLVQVYLDDDDANVIKYIAVTMTQAMKVNRVTSKDVTLKTLDGNGIGKNGADYSNKDNKSDGFKPVTVTAVKSDDDAYATLKDLKADAIVVVTPLTTDGGKTWSADKIFVPTTASGTISKVKVNSADTNSDGLTVGGTDYKMSRNWTAEDADGKRTGALNGFSVNTKRESTVYMDSYGYAIYVSNVQNSTEYFIFDEYYQSIVDGKVHFFAQGWDIKGNEVSLDFGTQMAKYNGNDLQVGHVYAYENATSSTADYKINVTKTANNVKWTVADKQPLFKASDVQIAAKDVQGYKATDTGIFEFKKDIKFLFPTEDTTDGTLETVTCKDGAQKVDNLDKNAAQIVLNDSGLVQAVVMGDDRDVEVSANVLYVKKQSNETLKDGSQKHISIFDAYINGELQKDLTANKTITDGRFYTYKVDDATGVYTLNEYTRQTGKATSVITTAVFKQSDLGKLSNGTYNRDKNYLAGDDAVGAGNGVVEYLTNNGTVDTLVTNLNLRNATIIDTRSGETISSASDLADYNKIDGKSVGTDGIADSARAFKVALVYNDSSSSSNEGRVAYLFVLSSGDYSKLKLKGAQDESTTVTMYLPSYLQARVNGGEWTTGSVKIPTGKTGTDAKVEFKALSNGKLYQMKVPAGFTVNADGTAGAATKSADSDGIVTLYVLAASHTGISYALRDLSASRIAYATFVKGLTKDLEIGTTTNWVGGWYVVPGSVNINKTGPKLVYTLKGMNGNDADTTNNGSVPTGVDLNKLIAAVMKDDARFDVVTLFSDGTIHVEMDDVTYEIDKDNGSVSTPTTTLPANKTDAEKLNGTREDELIESVTAPVVEESKTEVTVKVEANNVTDISKMPNAVLPGPFPIYKDEYQSGSQPIYNDPGEKSAIIAVELGDLINAVAKAQQDALETATDDLTALNKVVSDLVTDAVTAKGVVDDAARGTALNTTTLSTKLTAVKDAAATVVAVENAAKDATDAANALTADAASMSAEIQEAVSAYVAFVDQIVEAKEAAVAAKLEMDETGLADLFFNTTDGKNNDTKLACILTSPGLKCYWKEGGYKDGQIQCTNGVYTKRINNNAEGATLTAYKGAGLAIQILESQTEATLDFYAVGDVNASTHVATGTPKFTITIDLTGINFA